MRSVSLLETLGKYCRRRVLRAVQCETERDLAAAAESSGPFAKLETIVPYEHRGLILLLPSVVLLRQMPFQIAKCQSLKAIDADDALGYLF